MVDAEPSEGPRGVGRRRALSVSDQVCSSASNFLVILLVARGAESTSIFGAFTVAFGVLTFVLTMSRSTLGVPLGTDLHRLEATEGRTMVARSLACGLALGGVVAVLLLGASAVLPDLDSTCAPPSSRSPWWRRSRWCRTSVAMCRSRAGDPAWPSGRTPCGSPSS